MSPLTPITPPLPAYASAQLPGEIERAASGANLRLPDNLQGPPEIASAANQPSFESLLGRMVQEVNAKQNIASDAVAALQSGANVSLHQTVIAMEEANVSFQLMVEVRNKLLESYQELMRMQI